jgi:hypothetical protein
MSGRADLLGWAALVGAVTAEALALRDRCTPASARARLAAAERAGLLTGTRPLADEPRLYALTRAGLRAAAVADLCPARLGAAGARHAVECARVAATLERAYPEMLVAGEGELRRRERGRGRPLASAALAGAPPGGEQLHRPDLVLWPRPPLAGLPVAIEVELTVKAPRRLLSICRAWARARCVSGTVYLASPQAIGPVGRAIEDAHAHGRIALLALEALTGGAPGLRAALERTVAVGA